LTLVSKNALLKEFTKNPILHHFLIGKNHWIHLAKTARVLSPQIWASLEQSHPICTFLPSKVPWGPYGPLRVNLPKEPTERAITKVYEKTNRVIVRRRRITKDYNAQYEKIFFGLN
jgi:hypothetical protein